MATTYSPDPNLAPALFALLERLERRVRLQRAVAAAAAGACLALMLSAVGVAALRTQWLDEALWWSVPVAAVLLIAAAGTWGWRRAVDRIAIAQHIDRHYGLHDRISTALSLSLTPPSSEEGQAFARAQIADALTYLDRIDLREATPWQRPADTTLLAACALLTIGVGLVPLPDHRGTLPPPFEVRYDAFVDDATLALERDRIEALREALGEDPDPQAEAMLDAMEELLDRAEARTISQREFLEELEKIETQFEAADEVIAQELETMSRTLADAAKDLASENAEALAEEPALKEAVDALANNDLAAASEALEELAESIKEEGISPERAERLAELFENFSDKLNAEDERLQELVEQHREALEKLAEQFGDEGNLTEEQQALLDEAEEMLSNAENAREEFDNSEAKNQLERLSRDLDEVVNEYLAEAKGSEDGDEGIAGQAEEKNGDRPDYRNEVGRKMEEASEQLSEAGEQKSSQQQREEIRRQMQEMRESMSRGTGEASEEEERRGDQVEDFMDRARGESEARDDAQLDEQRAQQQGEPGEDGEQKPGAEAEQAQGEEGQAQNAGQPGGEPPPGGEGGEPNSEGQTEGGEYRPGESDTPGGEGPDEQAQGNGEGELDGERVQEQAQGQENSSGKTRAEIIRGASEEGFASAEYQEVYADYESIAEEVMERENVPDGYRFFIKRYFQLIRPQQP
ncbi:hypothetical protein FRC98_06250 [Lujinxingia vulgaris]|uniref:Uncharacterized protein n=1 Tax=Lujinxingia vulgaris TaxID=2600176 RepID=A0A5C6XK16_9DELT|nr:hypothetical protein [Lujinxingia vulgaris]TXD38480.1 hypothetical protein FRC98_06250 [Lujinxingia vulgaris]